MSAVAPFVVCFPSRTLGGTEDTHDIASNIGATTVVELSFGRAYTKVGLARIKIKHVSGSAASFTPLLFSKTGITAAGDITQEYAGVSTLVATLFDPDITNSPVVMETDANGKLYLMIGPNAGSDNVFNYALRFFVYR